MKTLAQFHKALADEARLQILCLLFETQELCVCDLVEALGITQSKCSRHLATLRHAALVSDRRCGPWSYYSLLPATEPARASQLEALRTAFAHSPDAQRVRERLAVWQLRQERERLCSHPDPALCCAVPPSSNPSSVKGKS